MVLAIRQGSRIVAVNALDANNQNDTRIVLPEASQRKIITLSSTFANLPKGQCEVLLAARDVYSNLEDKKDYSVRFANENMWDNGYNKLGVIQVS